MSIVDSYRLEDLVPASLGGSWDMTDKSPRERLEALRDFLRTDVPNTCWDFGSVSCNPECGAAGCAIGWYSYLIGDEEPLSLFDQEMYEDDGNHQFRMSYISFVDTFSYGLRNRLCKQFLKDVTPLEVADAIDEYLEKENR